MKMKDLRALIFDVDGTLAETEEIHRQAFNQTFLNKGLSWKWSEEKYKELLKISGGLERLSAYKLEVEQKNSSISSELLSEIHETKTKKFAELVKKKKKPFETRNKSAY
jgi:beta-phosphoglucomutase-like phosphatase (HAD superfamily)